MENVIEVKNLVKNYKNFKLNKISFNVPKGKVVGLIGANGSGKTTTIKAILNLIKINNGQIKIFDKDFRGLLKQDREKIGVILDDSFLPSQLMTEDIDIIMSKFYSNWNSKLYKKYIKDFDLPYGEMIKNFSSGMKMKLKIACALSHESELLILDEPTNGLDPVFRYDFLDLLSDLVVKKGISILISSHITTDLEHIADEIIFIKDGRILLSENKKELFSTYKIVQCLPEYFDKINKKDYIGYLKYKDDYLILIDNNSSFIKKYKGVKVRNDSLEEIMLLFIKGEK